ncbi:MAG: hypothetical protein LUG66_04645 [Clostridiales bacterium]|nr:hypothetical protein [Clostridiales bacterium]
MFKLNISEERTTCLLDEFIEKLKEVLFTTVVIMLFSSGFGAAFPSILNIQSNSYGLAVLPSYLMYIYKGRQLLFYFLVSLFFSTALCFVLTLLFGVPKEAVSD